MNKQWISALLSVLICVPLALPAAASDVPARYATEERNSSTVAESGVVYTSIKGSLERVTLASLERKTIVQDSANYDLKAFSVQNGWLYWTGSGGIYKCKSDGSGLANLVAGKGISNLRLLGDSLYFIQNKSLQRAKSDGSGKQALALGSVQAFELTGTTIYYRPADDEETLYRCGLDGSKSSVAGELDGDWTPRVYGNTLYYSTGGKWYHSMASGKTRDTFQPLEGFPKYYAAERYVAEQNFGSAPSKYGTKVFNMQTNKGFTLPDSDRYLWMGSEKYFYFVQTQQSKGLYRVGWDGKGKKKLADSGEPILVAGGYLVYRAGNDIAFAQE